MAAERAAAERRDQELRQKREAAEEALRVQRPRPLSDVAATQAAEAAVNAAAAAGLMDADAAEEKKRELQQAAEARERLGRLRLFESDLALLGFEAVSEDDLLALDEKALRAQFRLRSRELHPDAATEEELAGRPSVYELNAAYTSLLKLVR